MGSLKGTAVSCGLRSGQGQGPQHGCNALMYVDRNGHFGVMEYLLENGVYLTKATMGDGWMPLHFAVEEGIAEILSILIDYEVSLIAFN